MEALAQRFAAVLAQARAAVPGSWRQALVRRGDLDRFLFAPEDVVVTVGQDGLVVNVARYLSGQPVVGVNPAAARFDGLLSRIAVERLAPLLPAAAAQDAPVERRTMVEAVLGDGQRPTALNEIFVGHRGHQSARYAIAVDGAREEQASSGLIVASGTGATGWARSIIAATGASVRTVAGEKQLVVALARVMGDMA